MDRLRDRTDELELIISSLTIFALFSLPGWLFNKYAEVYTHLSASFVIAGTLSATVVAGVSYGLAACFVVHLMARAYWVGLIGLRTVFPQGIDWNNIPGIGPLSRAYFEDTLPDVDTVIAKTDRLASSLFAVISMLTLGVLWFGTVFVLTLVAGGAIGAQFGLTNTGMGIGAIVLIALFLGAPVIVYLLDAQLAKRVPRLQQSRWLSGIVRALRSITSIAYPQRLVLPVQLTLQSNTRPLIFIVALTLGIVAIVVIGNVRAAASQNFTISGEFTYMGTDEVQDGFRSYYYEDMASPIDRFRAWPRVDSFSQGGSFARLFLPYQPLRDNLILDQLCSSPEEAEDPVACFHGLWAVRIDGRPVALDQFVAAERAELNMRGLIGLVPLTGLEPGLHRIEAVWNPNASEQSTPIDDRYTQPTRTYRIPIAFSPDFEAPLD